MIGHRLKQLRLARGMSLDELAAKIDYRVSKQSLSKYERNKSHPPARVLRELATALGVKANILLTEPEVRIEFIAYRRGAKFSKKEILRIENLVKQTLMERVRLQELMGWENGCTIPVQYFEVHSLEEAEKAAEELRSLWKLGTDPIANLCMVLETHRVHVLEIEAREKFDGLSAVAFSPENTLKAAAIVTRKGLPGSRQRLNMAHELGHLVLKIHESIDEEKAAFRFAGALLAPAATLRQEIGYRRKHLHLHELILLKRYFGISVQALLYRLRDLQIINESLYRDWCITINQMGWKKQEPAEISPERPQWLHLAVLRAVSEGFLTVSEGESLLKQELPAELRAGVIPRRELLKKTLTERRKILAQQARQLQKHYEEDQSWKELQGGDIIEY